MIKTKKCALKEASNN